MKPVIYQIFTRLYGNKATRNQPWGTRELNGIGRFADIDRRALGAIAGLGVSHVWYTGVIEHATMAKDPPPVVKGRAGSPYAITDYYDVNAELATDPAQRLDEFRALVQRTHQARMKAIIDFVPNHVARSYRSDQKPAGIRDFGEDDDKGRAFSPANNFYWLPGQELVLPAELPLPPGLDYAPWRESPARVSGNDVFSAAPSVNDWYETVKLNYGVDYQGGRQGHFDPVPDTWLKMRDILLYWAGFGVDGFRCDMAEMVPAEFWAWVIPQVNAGHPDIIFIAEIYNPDAYRDYLGRACFDYLYDKVGLYDAIRAVMEGKATVERIVSAWTAHADIGEGLLTFLENHDEQRLSSRFFAGDCRLGRPGMAVCAALTQGPVMVYFGQEVGEPADGAAGFSGDDGRTTIFDYWGVPEHQKLMNGGAWDGGLLSKQQKELREFYARLLGLCKHSAVLARGAVIFVPTGSEKALAWYREFGGERLFFAANFDRHQPVSFALDGRTVTVSAMDAIIPSLA